MVYLLKMGGSFHGYVSHNQRVAMKNHHSKHGESSNYMGRNHHVSMAIFQKFQPSNRRGSPKGTNTRGAMAFFCRTAWGKTPIIGNGMRWMFSHHQHQYISIYIYIYIYVCTCILGDIYMACPNIWYICICFAILTGSSCPLKHPQ